VNYAGRLITKLKLAAEDLGNAKEEASVLISIIIAIPLKN